MKGLKRLLIFLSFGLAAHSNAQTIAGGEIYYELISSNKYLVTANVYRHCSSNPLNSLSGFVIADTFKIPINFKRTLIQKINDTCGNPCNIQNTKSKAGYERHTFTDTVDLNSSPYDSVLKAGLCSVKFAFYGTRTSLITTHDPGTQVFYLDAQVNICIASNTIHSPTFSFDPRFTSACNQPMWYNPGPLDTLDFDSLSFEMDAPLLDEKKTVTYVGNFTKVLPLTPYCPPNPGVINCRALPNAKPPRGFYFDADLCQIGVTPTKCDEISNLKVKVKEWRRDSLGKFQFIGYVCREMNLEIKQMSDNMPPYFTGNSKYSICNGKQICFTTGTKEDPYLPKQTILDTVRFDWNHGIPSASFTVINPSNREKEAVLCWTPKKGLPKHRYVFVAAAWDKKCNAFITMNGYSIMHNPTTEFNKKTTINACNLVQMKAWKDGNINLYGNIDILDQNNKNIFYSNKSTDSFTINKNGTFYVRYSFTTLSNKTCLNTLIDTIQINSALYKGFEKTAVDTSVCKTFPAKLIFSPASYKQFMLWTWYRNDTFLNNVDTVVNEVITKNTKYKLVLMDTRNCTATSERNFLPFIQSSNLLPSGVNVCPNTKVDLIPNTSILKAPLNIKWVFRSQNLSVDTLKFLPQQGEKIRLYITDDNHCNVSDSLSCLVYPAVGFKLSSNLNSICKDSTVVINPSNLAAVSPYNTVWKINGYDSLSFKDKSSFNFKIIEDSRITLKITDKNLCSYTDSLDVTDLGHPAISLLDSGTHCSGDPLYLKAKLSNYSGPTDWSWKIDQINVPYKTPEIQLNKTKDFEVILNLKHRYYCLTSDTLKIKLFPLPKFKILSDSLYNRFALVQMQVDNTYKNYSWSNGTKTQDNQFWAASLGAAGTYYIWCKVTDSNACSNEIHKTIKTVDLPSGLNELSSRKINLQPNPFSDYIKIISDENTPCVLMELSGKIILETNLLKGENELNTESLAKGMYLIKVGEKVELVVKE
jgi:hypothetical protein